MAVINEIAEDVYRISTYVPEWNLQFNQFLVKDEQPLLYHAGMRMLYPAVREAVAKVIKPSELRWISFSHYEVDECGALNEWLQEAPQAQAACSVIAARVNLADFASRPARELNDDDVIETGKRRFRFKSTPHFPHGWDAGMLFEETTRTLFCSDILHQFGDGKPLLESSPADQFREAVKFMETGPLANYMPYYKNTDNYIRTLSALDPAVLAIMHGSSYAGNGAKALTDAGEILKQVLGSVPV